MAIAGNHLHLIIQPESRRSYQRFIRGATGVLARFMFRSLPIALCARRRFWESRPFTRIVRWGRDFCGVKNYLMKNRLDLIGMTREDSSRMLITIAALRGKFRYRDPP